MRQCFEFFVVSLVPVLEDRRRYYYSSLGVRLQPVIDIRYLRMQPMDPIAMVHVACFFPYYLHERL